MKKERKAKPCERCEPPRASFRGGRGKSREVSVTSLYRAAQAIGAKGEPVPYLRLSGRWLERLGFASGCRVVVTEERGKLTLTIVRTDERPFAPGSRF
ncbi:MAG TPA: SymE family type I addiction module toxin [Thermoanaerobaculia bacterium]|nr:SymE family type I addiction module toxin [Thermoanaerobaculia bacterium]